MAQSYIYEQHYRPTGWFDDGGLSKAAWFDEDIVDPVIPLYIAMPAFFQDPDTFYVTKPVTIVAFPARLDDPDEFFRPMSARALVQGNQMLRNEVRRIR